MLAFPFPLFLFYEFNQSIRNQITNTNQISPNTNLSLLNHFRKPYACLCTHSCRSSLKPSAAQSYESINCQSYQTPQAPPSSGDPYKCKAHGFLRLHKTHLIRRGSFPSWTVLIHILSDSRWGWGWRTDFADAVRHTIVFDRICRFIL